VNLASRAQGIERLDASSHDEDDLALSLSHMAGVNRWLGGARVVMSHLRSLLPDGRPARVLDIGTGGADIPMRIARWVRPSGKVTVFALDRQLQVARLASVACADQRNLIFGVADGERLPFRDGSMDVVLASMTLHHLPDEQAGAFITEMARVARHGVVVNDLERHAVNYWGARALSLTWWRGDPYTRHDGPLSVLRSFTPGELLGIGRGAGLREVRIHRHFPYRLALVGKPPVRE
jgi:SAM-dependent methyltransferase